MGAARTHPNRRRSRWLGAAVTYAALLALAPSSAHAAQALIDGSPLNITATDAGIIQVTFDGSGTGEFTAQPTEPAYAGLTAALRTSTTANFTVFSYTTGGGFRFSPTAGQPPTVSGNGSPGTPFVLTAQYDAATGPQQVLAHVTQQIVYVNGTTDIAITYSVQTSVAGAAPFQGRLFESADLQVAGSDTGTGFFSAGPPRQVGGVHPLGNGVASLVEASPWTHYQEGSFSTIQNVVNSQSATPQNFNDSVDPQVVDNAAGVQWDFTNLTPASPVGASVIWRFARTSPLQLLAAQPTRTTGQTATVTVMARNGDGTPNAGRLVRYAIAGANPGSGTVTTGTDGSAAISWVGTKAGTDTLNAFLDLDGNGARDVNTEPQASATVTWTAAPPVVLPPPVPGKSVNVQVVSGQVFVKVASRPRATGPPKGFVPLTAARQIPIGSQLDTRKGRVSLTSAADTGKKTQKADFYQGLFQVKQALPKKKSKKAVALTTDIVLKGQLSRSQCAPLKRASAATVDKKKGPKSVLGKLWGNGKGKFRTTGKYSAATVRGTIWLTQDECDGTLTKVTRGTVSVRDFKRKKTVKVKAGRSYLARAVRRR